MKTSIPSTEFAMTNGEPSLREWFDKMQHEFGYNEQELREALRTDFKENNLIEWPRRFDEMFDHWFRRTYRRRSTSEDTQARVLRQKEMTETIIAKVKERDNRIRVEAKIDLLHEIWPNGKSPFDSTAKEIVQYGETGGAYFKRVAALARKQHPRVLGKKFLTSDLLADIFNTSGSLNAPRK